MKAYPRMSLQERWTYKPKGSPTRPGAVPRPERRFARCPACNVCLYEADLARHVRLCSTGRK
jgi:acetyl-CoA carboxylase beta subunit